MSQIFRFLKYEVAGGAPQKERGSGTSLSKAEGSRGEVSLLSATQPLRQRKTITGDTGSV